MDCSCSFLFFPFPLCLDPKDIQTYAPHPFPGCNVPLHIEWRPRNGWQGYDPQRNQPKPEGRRVTLVIVDGHNKISDTGGLKPVSHSSGSCDIRSRCLPIRFLVRTLFLACRQTPSWSILTWPFLHGTWGGGGEDGRERETLVSLLHLIMLPVPSD